MVQQRGIQEREEEEGEMVPWMEEVADDCARRRWRMVRSEGC